MTSGRRAKKCTSYSAPHNRVSIGMPIWPSPTIPTTIICLRTSQAPAAACHSLLSGFEMDDVQAITNLILSYVELLDLGDLDGLSNLFARATVRTQGGPPL